MIPIKSIKNAKNTLSQVLEHTPLAYAPILSNYCNTNIYLKKESLQRTGSFKIRGAFNKIASLDKEEIKNGIIASSAGNHAQGVAYAAKHFGIKAFIVMPETTPLLKIEGVKELKANVILKGDDYKDAYEYALDYSKKHSMVFIHPFADDLVMAGQGTIALEMIQSKPTLNKIVIPIGGGGLIGGIGSAYKQLKPKVQIIGVVAKGANAMHKSYNAKQIIHSQSVKTIADGIAVRNVNPKMLEYVQNLVDDIVVVDEEEIANAILFLLERQKLIVEGAGAVSVAALLHNKIKVNKDDNIGAILSGGNIDVNMINLIIQKGMIKSSRTFKFSIVLVDRPGSLEKLTNLFNSTGANIVQIGYDRTSTKIQFGDAVVTITLETKGFEHKQKVQNLLKKNKYNFIELK